MGLISALAFRSKSPPNSKSGGGSANSEGVEGWVLHSLLSGRRTALVTPGKKGESSKIYARASRKRRSGRDASIGRDRAMSEIATAPGVWSTETDTRAISNR